MKRVAYYISGHGYGHAVRSAEVIRTLVSAQPECFVHVRTSAPAMLFEHLPSRNVQVHPIEVDAGVVERDGSLRIDPAQTLERLKDFVNSLGDREEAEVGFVRREDIGLLLADVPFLAGSVAAKTGLPCLAISNFTWDWVFEPILAECKQGEVYRHVIRQGYRQMQALLRLPFGHETSVFDRVVDVPLVATQSDKSENEILAALDIRPDDPRRRVLVARRGGFSRQAVLAAAEAGPVFLFLFMRGVDGDLPENVRLITGTTDLTFEDTLSVCDTVISKLGYGTLAACAAAGTDILYPPRDGFREDEILEPEAARYLKTREIAVQDYENGNWAEGLQSLQAMAPPSESLSLDGARVCAEMIAQRLKEES
jgi:hypothetical protein